MIFQSFCEAQSVSGRDTGCRRMRRSLVGRRGALTGEATGGGGRGARRWWGGVRRSRKRCSLAGEAWGGGGRGTRLGSARSGDAGSGCVGSGVVGSIGQREVGRVLWVGAHAGSVGWARGVRLVDWTVGSR
jgi:hypothetical protein